MDQALCEACGSLQGRHTLVHVLRVPQANGREVPRPGVMTQQEGSTPVGIQRGAASCAAAAGWVGALRECSR